MKMIRYFVITIISLPFLGCAKTETIPTSDAQVGISRVTNFVDLTRTGAEIISIVQGGTFTDPGAKATEAGQTVAVTTSGTVNVNTPGLYTITYSAKNKDGFSKSVTRTVVVISGPETPGVDLSGKYSYVGSTVYTATVEKVAQGVYITDNSWSGATIIPIVFVSLDGLTISIPNQPTGFGAANGNGTYTPATGRLVFRISIPSQGISNSTRTWQKL